MTIQHPAQILFTSEHPLTSAFDMEFLRDENRILEVRVSAPQEFSNGDGKTVHSGFTTLFLDTVMGSCVLGSLEEMQPIATVKLTNQQFRQAEIGENIVCRARYDGESDEVAFVSAEVKSITKGDLIATSVGTFMIGTRARPLMGSQP